MDMHAWIDVNPGPNYGVLMSWGYQQANCRWQQPLCDEPIVVPWDFDLECGKWRWDGADWVPFP